MSAHEMHYVGRASDGSDEYHCSHCARKVRLRQGGQPITIEAGAWWAGHIIHLHRPQPQLDAALLAPWKRHIEALEARGI